VLKAIKGHSVKIGELAAATQTQVETIRYYEREGLLPPAPRTDGNYRIYGATQVERLSFIRHCRSLDMTLEEIRLLLRIKDSVTQGCGDVSAVLEAHLGHVAARMRELRQLERQLKALRARCQAEQDAANCGILAALSQPAVNPRADITRLPGTPARGRVRSGTC
jgi:Cd(II)/Pb(II)-responsive transcriptional regulator